MMNLTWQVVYTEQLYDFLKVDAACVSSGLRFFIISFTQVTASFPILQHCE